MPYFHDLATFIYMGGYADYIWPAYGIGLLVLFCNGWLAKRKLALQIKQSQKINE